MNKTKNIWSLICRSSSIDIDTNAISLLEIVDEITISSDFKVSDQGPGANNIVNINLPFEIVTVWEQDGDLEKPPEVHGKITLLFGKEETEILIFPITFEAKKKRIRLRIKFAGLKFRGYGVYKFKVFLKEMEDFNLVQTMDLEVKSNPKI